MVSEHIEQAVGVIGDVAGLTPEECDEIAQALDQAGLLAPSPLHEEWAIERPDPVDDQPRYDRFPTLEAAVAERWGSDRVVHRAVTDWEEA